MNRILLHTRDIQLNVLLSSIGRRLSSFELQHTHDISFDAMFDHCGHSEHLDVQNEWTWHSTSQQALFSFLRRPSGCQLRSLNLNRTLLYTMQAEELAELLQSTGILPRLRELRLINESPIATVFDIVSDALSDNKMIKLVELCTAFYPEMQDRIDDKHRHDRVEMTTLPLAHRLAFISVFSSDRWILERVFEFTGMAAQRMLLWTIKWRPPYFDKF